jgi:hypothetical protein
VPSWGGRAGGDADGVASERQFVELRHRHAERFLDAVEAGVTGPLRSPCELLKKIAPKRIFGKPLRTIRLPHELRYEVKLADCCEQLRQFSELLVGVDLLKMRLCLTAGVALVVLVWPLEDHSIPAPHDLAGDDRYSLVVLRQFEAVCLSLRVAVSDFDLYRNRGIPACMQGTNL